MKGCTRVCMAVKENEKSKDLSVLLCPSLWLRIFFNKADLLQWVCCVFHVYASLILQQQISRLHQYFSFVLSLCNTSDSYSIPTTNRDSFNSDLKFQLISQHIKNVQYCGSSCVCFRAFVLQHRVSVPLVLLNVLKINPHLIKFP